MSPRGLPIHVAREDRHVPPAGRSLIEGRLAIPYVAPRARRRRKDGPACVGVDAYRGRSEARSFSEETSSNPPLQRRTVSR
jgi:hypothetical protein